MNITLHIEATCPTELKEAIAGLSGIISSPTVTDSQQEKPKRTQKPATTKPADKELEAESSQSESQDQETSTDSKDIPKPEDLRAKALEVGKTPEAKKAIKALLDEFESKSISDVPEEKRVEFLARLEAL